MNREHQIKKLQIFRKLVCIILSFVNFFFSFSQGRVLWLLLFWLVLVITGDEMWLELVCFFSFFFVCLFVCSLFVCGCCFGYNSGSIDFINAFIFFLHS